MENNDAGAEAIHLSNGDQHIVGVKSLKVLLTKDGNSWFAQGLEIDYASFGKSVEDAKINFEKGLKSTIAEYLKLHGSIEKFLKPAPQDAWAEYYAADPSVLKQKVTTVTFHDLAENNKLVISDNKEYFPFGEIEFLEPRAA